MRRIKRVAVLGSGVMGGAIAAHLANCGIPSLMLDIVPPNVSAADKTKRNAIVEASKEGLLKAKPAPLYRSTDIALIETGNFEDDMPRIGECDWIIEVVKEDLAIKNAIFEQVARYRSSGAIVSTNTSGIPIRLMTQAMDADLRAHFLGTHFFNPPRYLKLLEIIPGPDTLPEVIRDMASFGENVLGKGVVYAKDTPCFVANRILMFVMQYILRETIAYGLAPEEVDALTGPVIGHAKSATFRTADLVGLDTYLHVLSNIYNGCTSDEQHDLMAPPALVKALVEKGCLGAKSGAGFYKKTDQRDEQGQPVILSLDVNTLDYVPQRKPVFECLKAAKEAPAFEDKVRAMHTGTDKGSEFLWRVFANTAIYAANRIGEIADDIVNIDNAVKWGFAWQVGIFETWDILGVKYVCDRMEAEGLSVPTIARALLDAGGDSFYTMPATGKKRYFDVRTRSYEAVPSNPNVVLLADMKKGGATVKENEFCSLLDLGDGIVCAEFHSKMNTIERYLLEMVQEGVNLVNAGQFEGMIVANQGPHFSAGANLALILEAIKQKNWQAIDTLTDQFQRVNMAMRFCQGPVVAAPHNYTFGGGIEMAQHAARVVLAGETYGGLVEVGVGVIPAGGGTKEMLRRALDYVPATVPEGNPFPYVRRAFETIGMAKTSTSGPELIDLGYFTSEDVVCVNWDHQVKRAKDVCRALILAGYRPPRPAALVALGEPVRAAFRSALYQLRLGGYASEHDVLIGEMLAEILTGGNRMPGSTMTEQDVLDLEREKFLSLCGTEKTQQRIEHMLATGKPLRN